MRSPKTLVERSRESARLSAAIVSTLDDTCSIQRLTEAEDNFGGANETWAIPPALANVQFAMDKRFSSDEAVVGDRLTEVNDFICHFPPGTDVTARDRITYKGLTFVITSIVTPTSVIPALRVYVKLLR